MLPESGWWKVHVMVYPATLDPCNNYLWRSRLRKWSLLFPARPEGCNGFYIHPRSVPLMLGSRSLWESYPKAKPPKLDICWVLPYIMLVTISQFSIYGVMISWIELSFKKVPTYKARGQYKIGYELIEHHNVYVLQIRNVK